LRAKARASASPGRAAFAPLAVSVNTFSPGGRQGVPLQVHSLIVGRYPRIADLHVFVHLSDESASL